LLGGLALEREAIVGLGVELSEGPGTIVGRYKLLQKIGEGGMGVVYMAEQTKPVVRKVALKIIKLGMNTKQVVARFEAERQALALMDHPNIAKVFDGGATATGRPYFVMELVYGIPVTEFCDKNKLGTRERLQLLIPICQAIQSAHQKGVIHRDIKPSNILVSLAHGKAEPKVIDFGIAKATHLRLTEKTLFTTYGQMIGTPAYMSPEQAEMTNLDVDTRTDVYSLGVLLYELLTGTPPYSSKELMSAGHREMQRIIAEEEPVKPSTRVSSMDGKLGSAVASSQGVTTSTLGKRCRGDLDWITMKCLEKDRRQRYGTPSELASDIERHLNSEPVTAAAPSISYRFLKFHRKHKILVRSAMVVSFILIVATAISSTLAVWNNRLRIKAEAAEERTLNQSLELENNLYVADMLAVESAVRSEEFSRAQQLLLNHRVEASGRDLRGLEWRFYWERIRGKQIHSFLAHDNEEHRAAANRNDVMQVEIVGDGKQVLSWGNDGTIKLWNLDDYQLVYEWRASSRFEISPNKRFLCFKQFGNELLVWDLEAMQLVRSLPLPDGHVLGFPFTYDNKNLVVHTSSRDPESGIKSRISIVDIRSGALVSSPDGWWTDFAVSPTAPLVWTQGTDQMLVGPSDLNQSKHPIQGYLWNYEQQTLLRAPISSHNMGVWFSPSGNFVTVSQSEEPFNMNAAIDTRIIQVSTGEEVSVLKGTYFRSRINRPSTVAFSVNEKFVAAPDPGSKSIGVWEVGTGERLSLYQGHPNGVRAIAFHPLFEDRVISVSDRSLQYWSCLDGRTHTKFTGQSSRISSLGVGPLGNVVTGGYDGSLDFWPGNDPSAVDGFPDARSSNTSYPIVSSQGKYLVLGEITAASGTVRGQVVVGPGANKPNIKRSVFAAQNSERLWEVPRTEKVLGFSPDERFLLTVSTNQFFTREVSSGAPSRVVTLETALEEIDFDRPIPRLQDLSPDGTQMATFNKNRTIRLISLLTGETSAIFDQPCTFDSVGFSPSGKKLFFMTADRLKSGIWDPAKQTVIWVESIEDGWMDQRPVVSPDESLIAGICYDRAVRVWAMESGKLIREFKETDVNQIFFTPDNQTFVMRRRSRSNEARRLLDTLKLFDRRTWRQVAELHPPPNSNWATRNPLFPDGHDLMYATEGKIRLLRIPFLEEIERSIENTKNP
jgi:serine/threonine protein kinase/WD40 repeat protein